MPCIHGHPIVDGTGMCAEGHAEGDPPLNTGGTIASVAELQNILHLMLAIQNTSLQNPATTRPDCSKAKPERPIIKQNSSDGDWQLFQHSWKRYKAICKLTELPEIRTELRCSCSHEVNQMIFDLVGPTILDACTEAQLLAHIKSVAVQGSHKEVHRQNFHPIKQEEGQRVTSFLAKLKSQAQLMAS